MVDGANPLPAGDESGARRRAGRPDRLRTAEARDLAEHRRPAFQAPRGWSRLGRGDRRQLGGGRRLGTGKVHLGRDRRYCGRGDSGLQHLGPGSRWDYKLTPTAQGGTGIDVTVERHGKGLKGRLIELGLAAAGTGMLRSQMEQALTRSAGEPASARPARLGGSNATPLMSTSATASAWARISSASGCA